MNFKPLKDEEEYKYTKYWVKQFKEDIEDYKKLYNNTELLKFILIAEPLYRSMHILEAEVQDYEHRKRGDY